LFQPLAGALELTTLLTKQDVVSVFEVTDGPRALRFEIWDVPEDLLDQGAFGPFQLVKYDLDSDSSSQLAFGSYDYCLLQLVYQLSPAIKGLIGHVETSVLNLSNAIGELDEL
jgi:hypothetical protein